MMEQIFKIIFDKSKAFCRDGTDQIHIVSALEMAKKLISSEGGNERIIIPAIIMHDIGWHLFSYEEELKTRGPALKNVELNHKHEVEGAVLADKILSELNYPEEEKEKIVEIISGHDNRSKPISKEDMIVKDADRLARYTPECFDAFRLKFKYNEGEYFDVLKSKIERWLFTDSARFLAREYLLKRRLGVPDVEFTDGIRNNLYKILIGLEGEVVKMVKENLEKIAIKTVKEKVHDTKRMIEIYLSGREYIDIEELQREEEFQSIAVQKVGDCGYIGIIDRESGCIIFHPNRRIINLPLETLKEKERAPEYLYGFWDWYNRALKGEESFSYYQGKTKEDEIVDKFQYVVPLDIKNAKWSVNAAASYDEFFKSIDILNKEIVQSVSEIADQAGYLADQVEQRTQELAESNRGLQKEIAERKQAETELKTTQEKLLEVARKAGMAEVAADVLHNVGNVLNSINVSTTLMTEKVTNSEVANLEKVACIINEHLDEIGPFLTEHPQGKHIPVYLTEVVKCLQAEQADIISKLQVLTDNVQHIKDIISMQQSYAKVSGLEVQVSLSQLIEDAIQINSAGLQRHGIRLMREFDELPDVEIDKQKVLQILVNLISNAKYALSNSKKEERIITIRLYRHQDDRFRIEVADNGVGISRDNLSKIFSHGFTTKQNGHGFGLHSSALAAKEMGGALTVYSDGVGQGATFTLELPFKPTKAVL